MTEEKGNVYAPTEVRVADVRAEGEQELAGRLERLGAAIIDGLIVGLLSWGIIYFAFSGIFATLTSPDSALAASLGAMGVMVVLYFGLYAGINWVFLKENGQTVGKKVLGIRIVRTDGTQADVMRILFLRYLPIQIVGMVPIIGGLIAILDALLIFRESRKCLHDNIADTIVVKA
jgi:uncharacterized RDD family membrane protein YckC